MSSHPSGQEIERFRGRLLTPSELIAFDGHLAVCAACRRRAGETRNLPAALATLRQDLMGDAEPSTAGHLNFEQIAAYVDDEADAAGRQALESHMAVCDVCAADVHDLAALKAELAASRPAARPAPPTPSRERLGRMWRLPRGPQWLPRVAAIAALVLVALAAATLYLRPDRGPERAHIPAGPSASPAPSPEEAGSPERTPPGTNDPPGVSPVPPPSLAEQRAGNGGASQPSQRPVLSLRDGERLVTLDEVGGVGGFGSLPPLYRRAVGEALRRQRVETPRALDGLTGEPGRLMGGPAEGGSFSLLSPVGSIIETDRPALRWTPLSGANGYTVSVVDADSRVVAKSPPLSVAEWAVPRPLERGRVYSWQVVAVRDGVEVTAPPPQMPQATFKVLGRAEVDELARARRLYGDSHLLLGTLYARAGLLDEAEREFRALRAANPTSAVARRLLRSVRARRGR